VLARGQQVRGQGRRGLGDVAAGELVVEQPAGDRRGQHRGPSATTRTAATSSGVGASLRRPVPGCPRAVAERDQADHQHRVDHGVVRVAARDAEVATETQSA
jgi:hypothetical protein